MRTIHRSCHRCPFPKPPPPPPSGDSRDPPRAQANFRHPLSFAMLNHSLPGWPRPSIILSLAKVKACKASLLSMFREQLCISLTTLTIMQLLPLREVRARNMSHTPNREGRDMKAPIFIDHFTKRRRHLPTVRANGLTGCSAKVMMLCHRNLLISSWSFHFAKEKTEGGPAFLFGASGGLRILNDMVSHRLCVLHCCAMKRFLNSDVCRLEDILPKSNPSCKIQWFWAEIKIILRPMA